MHALVGVWTAAEAQREEQYRGLHDRVVPDVTSHPGFVAGYWTRDPDSGKLHSMIVLESEASAEALKALVEGNAQQQARVGITVDLLAVTDVLADARA